MTTSILVTESEAWYIHHDLHRKNTNQLQNNDVNFYYNNTIFPPQIPLEKYQFYKEYCFYVKESTYHVLMQLIPKHDEKLLWFQYEEQS